MDGDLMEFINIGKIVGTHGIRGELKIASDSDFREIRFQRGNKIHLDLGKQTKIVEITSHRLHKNYDLVTIDHLGSINDVEQYVGCTVQIPKNELPVLDEGEFYFDEIIGKKATIEDGTLIGTILDILDLPQGEILVIAREGKKNVLVPFVDEFIKKVDEDGIIIRPIEGLLE